MINLNLVTAMEWKELKDLSQLEEISKESYEKPVLIFKHSTRCSISRASLARLERNWKNEDTQTVRPYFLDLISHRNVSDTLAERFDVEHESPQVIIIDKGKTVYNESHMAIDYQTILEVVKN